MAAATEHRRNAPLGLVLFGEARRHEDALRTLLGPRVLRMYNVANQGDLLEVVRFGQADAAVVDSEADDRESLQTLRMIRRVNAALPVVLVAQQVSRRFLEDALRLAAFSVAHKPLEREELLIQVRLIIERYHRG